jgi:hypothetical protein
VLRHGSRVLWTEPAVWEGLWRFQEVFELLIERFGERFRSLTPTPASALHLYGDDVGAAAKVRAMNARRAEPDGEG